MLSVADLIQDPASEILSEEYQRNKMVRLTVVVDLGTNKVEYITETYDGRWRFSDLEPAVDIYNRERGEWREG